MTATLRFLQGTGGIKPCVSAFGADQFDDRDPRQKKLIGKYYNYFYAAINVGGACGVIEAQCRLLHLGEHADALPRL